MFSVRGNHLEHDNLTIGRLSNRAFVYHFKLDFGSDLISAKKSCESVEEKYNEFKGILRDDYNYN